MISTSPLRLACVAHASVLLAGCGGGAGAGPSAGESASPEVSRAQAVLDAAVRKQTTLNEGGFAVRAVEGEGEPEGNEGVVSAVLWDGSLGVAAARFEGEAEGATSARVVDGQVFTAAVQDDGAAPRCWEAADLGGTFAAAPGSTDLDPGWPVFRVLEQAEPVGLVAADEKTVFGVEQAVDVRVPTRTLAQLVLAAVEPVDVAGSRGDAPLPARVVLADGRLDRILVDPGDLTQTGDPDLDRLASSVAEADLVFRVELSPSAENLRVEPPRPVCS